MSLTCLGCCPKCKICEENYSGAEDQDDEETIEGESNCDLEITNSFFGDVEIINGHLHVPSGSTVTTGVEASYVFFSVRSSEVGHKAIVKLGDITATITFGDTFDDGLMQIQSFTDNQSSPCNCQANSVYKSFRLCVGKDGNDNWGASLTRFSGTEPPVSCATTDPGSGPYGVVILSADGVEGVDFNQIILRNTDDTDTSGDYDECPECEPKNCLICYDQTGESPFFHPFSTSNCQWNNLGGFGNGAFLDNQADTADAIAVSGKYNLDGVGILSVGFQWGWSGEGVARMGIGCNSSGVGGWILEVENYSSGPCCTRLYEGATLVSETQNFYAGASSGVAFLYYNGRDCWVGVNSEVTADHYLAKHNTTASGGGHVFIGTGDIEEGTYITYVQVAVEWYAHPPTAHQNCDSVGRYCERQYYTAFFNMDEDNLPCEISLSGTWEELGGDYNLYTTTSDSGIQSNWTHPEENLCYVEFEYAHTWLTVTPTGNITTIQAGGQEIKIEILGAYFGDSGYIYQGYEVTVGGVTQFAVCVNQVIGHNGYTGLICMGEGRTRVCFIPWSQYYESYAGGTVWAGSTGGGGDGNGFGITADTLTASQRLVPVYVEVGALSESAPDNSVVPSFTDTPCLDCLNPDTENCGEGRLPFQLQLTVAMTGDLGGDGEETLDALCGDDVDTMEGTFTLTKLILPGPYAGSYAEYQVLLTDQATVEDFITKNETSCLCHPECVEAIYPCVSPVAYILRVTTSGGFLNFQLRCYFSCAPLVNSGGQNSPSSMVWEGSVAGPFDCEDFSEALTTTGISYADQFTINISTI